MLIVYGRSMPFRILEEIRFWKMKEKEASYVIRQMVPNLESQFVRLMQEWENVFAQAEEAAHKHIENRLHHPKTTSKISQNINELIHLSTVQSQEFVKQLYQMMEHSRRIRGNMTVRTVMFHMIRESEYFLNVIHAITHSDVPDVQDFQLHSQPMQSPNNISDGASVDRNEDQIQVRLGSLQTQTSFSNEGTWSDFHLKPNDSQSDQIVPVGGHTLPPLPYAYNDLEPYIDEQTMKLHHDEHHLSYVKGLNTAEKKMQEARQKGDYDLIKHWEREAAFHGAGHYLHTLFWNVMSPKGGGKPTETLALQIEKDFGGFDAFKSHFSKAAEKVEGSGWAILVWSPRSRRLEILQVEKHQNLSQWDVVPVLPLDVWEHSYYLKYPNQRAKYIEAWWNVVHWPYVNERFVKARELKWTPT